MPKQRTKKRRYSAPIRARTRSVAVRKWKEMHKYDLADIVSVKKNTVPKIRGMSLYSVGYTYR